MIFALLLACIAIDGDTLRCGRERVRLIGIDAPEMPGHCARWRRCVPGDPFKSRDSLRGGLRLGDVRIERRGVDRYGRTLAVAYAGGQNLACLQLASGHAVYVARWDVGERVGRECR